MAHRKDLQTPTARARLDPRREPYWIEIGSQRHLGYRRLKGRPGTWVVRVRIHSGARKKYTFQALGQAEDIGQAEDNHPQLSGRLTFEMALEAATLKAAELAGGGRATVAMIPTVADACRAYVDRLRERDQRYGKAETSFRVYVWNPRPELEVPRIGPLKITDLTTEVLEAWHHAIGNGSLKPHGNTHKLTRVETEEDRRKRRATANVIWAQLRAALRLSIKRARLTPGIRSNSELRQAIDFAEIAIRYVEPFVGVDVARTWFSSGTRSTRSSTPAGRKPFVA